MLSAVKRCYCAHSVGNNIIRPRKMNNKICSCDSLRRTNDVDVRYDENDVDNGRISDNIVTVMFSLPSAVSSGSKSVLAFAVLLFLIASSYSVSASATNRPTPIYMNQFAVHIPKGKEVAEEVAARHGFRNIGQV